MLNGRQGCSRIDDDPSLHASCLDLLQGSVNMNGCFSMNGQNISPSLGKGFNVVFRIGHHEMAVKDQFAVGPHGSNHICPKGNIGYEMAIHDIDMDIFHTGFFQAFEFFFKIGIIRC